MTDFDTNDPGMYTSGLMDVLQRTEKLAKRDYNYCVNDVLLLYCLTSDDVVIEFMMAASVDIHELQQVLRKSLNDGSYPLSDHNEDRISFTSNARDIFQHGFLNFQNNANDGDKMDSIDLLMAFFDYPECGAHYILEGFITPENVAHALATINHHDVRAFAQDEADQPVAGGSKESRSSTAMTIYDKKRTPPQAGENLQAYCVDLMKRSEAGDIDPVIGRKEEIFRTMQILTRRTKNNPVLVGEPGVGKTAIAEGLAQRILEGDVPDGMKNDYVFALDLGALIAGTKYRGDFEKRLKGVLEDIEKFQTMIAAQNPDKDGGRKPRVHLFIDEIHTIVGAGATSGTMDASNLLKPALAKGMSCIGATTYDEYRGIFSKDGALARRFQKVDVSVPSVEETITILNGLKSRYEDYHNVRYTKDAIEQATTLAKKHITDRHLPDSAIDLIDEAGAQIAIKKSKTGKPVSINGRAISEVVSKIAHIPAATLKQDETSALKTLKKDLQNDIFGQDQAITALADAIKIGRSGLGNENKPIGSFLFAGPTGVGKTEVTKVTAEKLGIPLIRFDMSEYMEKHTASRLVGAPPGYVGFDQGGLLTEAINKNPHCVLLLDEIEKAHPDIFNLLLQVMDHGTLTDNNGREADFRNVILVMTSNAGAETIAKRSIGFVENDNKTDGAQEIARVFTPEFRNRLDATIQFAHLQPEQIRKVVDKFIGALEKTLADKKITLSVTSQARDWLVEKGYDRTMGARPMERVIKQYLKEPLADEILFGALAKGGHVTVDFNQHAANDNNAPPLSLAFNQKTADKPQADKPQKAQKSLPAPAPGS